MFGSGCRNANVALDDFSLTIDARCAVDHRDRRRERQRQDDPGAPAARLHRADDRRGALPRQEPLASWVARDWLEFRREVQAIFQDPFEVYNPFYRVDHVLTVPIAKFKLGQVEGRGARA